MLQTRISLFCIPLLARLVLSSITEEYGFPCRFGSTMKLSRTLHGLPNPSKPPFSLEIFDAAGNTAKYYELHKKYLVRVSGKIQFEGIMMQSRLAHPAGYLIGSLRGGTFLPTDNWHKLGLRPQSCPFSLNDSITHANAKAKKNFEVWWSTDYDVGDVQFTLTIISNQTLYWERWRPRSGFFRPEYKIGRNAEINETLFEEANEYTNLTATTELPKLAATTTAKFITPLKRKAFSEQLELEPDDVKFLTANDRLRKMVRYKREAEAQNNCPCENGGECITIDSTSSCKCAEGFTGSFCNEVDYCVSAPCDAGTCVNNPEKATFSCSCPKDRLGSRCEIACPPNLCNGNGTCTLKANGAVGCECKPGITGSRCEREVNECNWLRCEHAKECIDKFNDYKCVCEDGWMGKNCERPCQDVYGTCRVWEREGECMRIGETDFFEYNCAVTCKQCTFRNDTIRTNRPIPHILLPLTWLLGKWRVFVRGSADLPFDFEQRGYVETLTFAVAEGLVFGTPAINYSAVAVSTVDPTDVHVSNGFLTIQQYPDDVVDRKAALMTTSNLGFTAIEEGIMEFDGMHHNRIHFKTRYLGIHPHIRNKWPDKMKRTFERKQKKLYQRIAKAKGAKGKKFTKIYTKVENFLY